MSARLLKLGLTAAMVVAFTAMAGPATAAITPTSTASDIAGAIASDSTNVTGASFDALPPEGTPNAVSDTVLTGFPTDGGTYGILTTGDATIADAPNNAEDSGADIGGGNVRGDTDFDTTVLRLDLDVPEGANCLSLDFRFLSEEFPEFVGDQFNDAFIAELDDSTWSTSGSSISSPDNFAFDPNGDVVSINSTGVADMTEAAANGTTYDGATQLLQARTPVTPGEHSLYLSIFDQGDNIYDSAVFVDNVSAFSGTGADCQEGAQAPTPTGPDDQYNDMDQYDSPDDQYDLPDEPEQQEEPPESDDPEKTKEDDIPMLPDTGGASLFALGAGALLVAGGLLARRILR